MFRILLFILIQFALLGGIGALSQRLLGKRIGLGVFGSFWMGLAAVLAVGQFTQLLAPLNGLALGALVVLGLLGCRWWVPQAWHAAREAAVQAPSRAYVFVFAVLLALFCLGAASRIAMPRIPMDNDTAIYHLNAVRWMNEYPAVPGLAHLHDRLGFNSSFLLYAAIIDNGPLDRRAAWAMPGLFVLVAAAQLLTTLFFDRRRENLAARIFSLVALAYVVKVVWNLYPSLHYDRSMLMVQFVLILEVLRHFGGLWCREAGNTAAFPSRETLIYWTCLAAITATFKLPGLFVLFLTVVWIAVLLLWRGGRFSPDRSALTEIFATFWLPGSILLGWFSRNAVLSGWLFYPAPLGNLHLPWSIDPATVERLLQRIRSWGRLPGTDQDVVWGGGFWDWFKPWHQAHYRTIEKDLLWLGAFSLLAWLLHRRPGATPLKARVEAFLAGLTGLTLVMWFRSSPDLRFGDGYFWMWGGLFVAFALAEGFVHTRRALPAAAAFSVYLLCSAKPDIVPTRPFHWWKVDRVRAAELTERVIDNGQTPPLKVWVPADGNIAGDSPLPTTAYPSDRLLMREPGNLRAGFVMKAAEPEG